jgi:nucleoid DNA-binding protein
MNTIKKKEIAKRIAQDLGITATLAGDVIQQFLDEIITELGKGNRLEFRNFGVFESRVVKPRQGRNPRTGEIVQIPEKRTVRFKIGKIMKQEVQKQAAPAPEPESQPESSPPEQTF